MYKNISVVKRRVHFFTILFIAGLVLSGLTVFPIITEVGILNDFMGVQSNIGQRFPLIGNWVDHINRAVIEISALYPFIFYGTDWLGFAHIVIAIAFIGVLKDPVKNIWVVEFGMIACALVIPFAFLCGPFRGIPLFWTIADCSFGVFGFLLLWYIHVLIKKIEAH